jgi:hypothetical protein
MKLKFSTWRIRVGHYLHCENLGKLYNKEIIQLFGDLDILSFVRKSLLSWIGHINRMNSKRKVSQVFKTNIQGNRLTGRSKNRLWGSVFMGKLWGSVFMGK